MLRTLRLNTHIFKRSCLSAARISDTIIQAGELVLILKPLNGPHLSGENMCSICCLDHVLILYKDEVGWIDADYLE